MGLNINLRIHLLDQILEFYDDWTENVVAAADITTGSARDPIELDVLQKKGANPRLPGKHNTVSSNFYSL